MKKMISIFMLLASFTSFACETYEAQFIGTVKEVRNGGMFGCFYKLNDSFKMYNIHGLCPLDQEDLLSLEHGLSPLNITYGECQYKVGDQISGVASWDGESNFGTLEN